MQSRDLFEILIREHAPMLGVFLRSALADRTAVDDVFQETVLAAWKGLDGYDHARPFGAWLRGIAVRQVAAAWRRQGAERLLGEGAAPVDLAELEQRCAELERAPGDTLDERLELLRACLDRLEEEERIALELRYAEELSLSGIAQRLGLGVEALKKRVQRARARLARCLEAKLAGLGGSV
jgi:RNA polymerase sigma-70 factor (ECF subfamily)